MKKTILVIFLFSINVTVFSQTDKEITVQGRIKDSLSNTALEYATIRLYDTTQTTLFYETITDAKGSFSMKNVVCQKYTAVISFVGFKRKIIEIDMTPNNRNYQMEILLTPDNEILEGVEIIAEHIGTRITIDRNIFIPDSASLRRSTTGLELLAEVPGVDVNKATNEITYFGDDNVLILIDGSTSGRNLNAINPKDIARIETTDSPSAEYDSGIGNVINIILKDKLEQGFKLATQLEYYWDNSRNNSNIQLEYQFAKVRIFGTYYLQWSTASRTDSSYRWNNYDGIDYEYFSGKTKPYENQTLGNTFQYGIDYRINARNILNFTGNFEKADVEWDDAVQSSYYVDSQLSQISQIKTDYDSKNAIQNYTLYYKHSFKKEGQNFSLNSNLYFMNRDSETEREMNYLYFPDSSTKQAFTKELYDYRIKSLNVKANYNHPFNEQWKGQFGTQFYRRRLTDKYDSGNDGHLFDYDDNRIALYSSFSFNKNKLSLYGGVRAEYFSFKVDDSTQNGQWNIIPSASISYEFGENHTLQTSFNKYLSYPDYLQLLPFIQYSGDSLLITTGNPYLRPQKSYHLGMGYYYTKKNTFLRIWAEYSWIQGSIAPQRYVLENGVMGVRMENILNSQEANFMFYGEQRFFKRFKASGNMLTYYANYDDNRYNGWTFYFRFNFSVDLPYDIYFQTSMNYQSKSYSHDGYFLSPFNWTDISLSKSLFKNKGKITLSGMNLLKSVYENYYWADDYKTYSMNSSHNYRIMLRFNYFFTAGKKIEKEWQESLMESDRE